MDERSQSSDRPRRKKGEGRAQSNAAHPHRCPLSLFLPSSAGGRLRIGLLGGSRGRRGEEGARRSGTGFTVHSPRVCCSPRFPLPVCVSCVSVRLPIALQHTCAVLRCVPIGRTGREERRGRRRRGDEARATGDTHRRDGHASPPCVSSLVRCGFLCVASPCFSLS
jgi:hypothetical protein